MKRDCPQRQRSQGFEPVQVQSSVRQARTQVVPSHYSLGQRNQFPLRGATQAPSAVQTGQRARIRVEVKYRAHRSELRGPRGVSTP